MCVKCRRGSKKQQERAKAKHRNSTTFVCGFDPRRHQLTPAERRKGFRNAITRHEYTEVGGWLREKVRRWYCNLRQKLLQRKKAS